jgi:Domain of unknown function (DUF1772)
MIPEIVATLASSIFFGAALYINLVEQPARVSCGRASGGHGVEAQLQAGNADAGPLALIGSVAALMAWWLQGSAAWLVGGSLFLSVVPFTLIVILLTNRQLESPELDIRSEEADCLLRRWGRLHAIRTLPSGMAFLVFLSILTPKR